MIKNGLAALVLSAGIFTGCASSKIRELDLPRDAEETTLEDYSSRFYRYENGGEIVTYHVNVPDNAGELKSIMIGVGKRSGMSSVYVTSPSSSRETDLDQKTLEGYTIYLPENDGKKAVTIRGKYEQGRLFSNTSQRIFEDNLIGLRKN